MNQPDADFSVREIPTKIVKPGYFFDFMKKMKASVGVCPTKG
jgi:hypothetical protein